MNPGARCGTGTQVATGAPDPDLRIILIPTRDALDRLTQSVWKLVSTLEIGRRACYTGGLSMTAGKNAGAKLLTGVKRPDRSS